MRFFPQVGILSDFAGFDNSLAREIDAGRARRGFEECRMFDGSAGYS
jgi:hypothetical protein